MITDAELIVDRRRLKRRLTFWRIAAVRAGAGGHRALFWTPATSTSFETISPACASTA